MYHKIWGNFHWNQFFFHIVICLFFRWEVLWLSSFHCLRYVGHRCLQLCRHIAITQCYWRIYTFSWISIDGVEPQENLRVVDSSVPLHFHLTVLQYNLRPYRWNPCVVSANLWTAPQYSRLFVQLFKLKWPQKQILSPLNWSVTFVT